VPAGTVTVTVLCGMKPVLGVKVSVFPPLDQVPATAGVSVGNGDLVESESEKVKTIAAFPLMPVDPFGGAAAVTVRAEVAPPPLPVELACVVVVVLELVRSCCWTTRVTIAPMAPPTKRIATTASTFESGERRRRRRDFGMSVPPLALSTRLCTTHPNTHALVWRCLARGPGKGQLVSRDRPSGGTGEGRCRGYLRGRALRWLQRNDPLDYGAARLSS
jgi:hypothetical protein